MLVYLAGPEVFLPDAVAIGAEKKKLCAEMGFQGLFPFDNVTNEVTGPPTSPIDRLIYRENVAMMRRVDFGIFNLTPFRGPSADVGTVYELGLIIGMGKPAFGYSNDGRDLRERVSEFTPCSQGLDGVLRDAQGLLIEDFGNADNLMIDCGLAEQAIAMVRRNVDQAEMYRDLGGFRACLEAAHARLCG